MIFNGCPLPLQFVISNVLETTEICSWLNPQPQGILYCWWFHNFIIIWINAIVINSIQHIYVSDSPPPKLRVNPPLITETDSVTLDCQTPPSVFGSQCYFFTLSAVNVREFSCQKTLTGTELLKMSSHSSPAEVKIKCFYMLKLEVIDFSSLHSETASINIRTQSKWLSLLILLCHVTNQQYCMCELVFRDNKPKWAEKHLSITCGWRRYSYSFY